MSYNTKLQTNNTNLQSLIDKANALPDAGSGEGTGTETEYDCEISFNALSDVVYSFDALRDGTLTYGTFMPIDAGSLSLIVNKGTIFHACKIDYSAFASVATSGDIELLVNEKYIGAALRVNGSGTITFTK